MTGSVNGFNVGAYNSYIGRLMGEVSRFIEAKTGKVMAEGKLRELLAQASIDMRSGSFTTNDPFEYVKHFVDQLVGKLPGLDESAVTELAGNINVAFRGK